MARIRLKQSKCSLFQSSVEFLGHTIDAHGVHTPPAKCRAIVKAQAPRVVTKLHSILGLLNCYGRFIPKPPASPEPIIELRGGLEVV